MKEQVIEKLMNEVKFINNQDQQQILKILLEMAYVEGRHEGYVTGIDEAHNIFNKALERINA